MEEIPNNPQQSKQASDDKKVPSSVGEILLNKLTGFSGKYGPHIQTWSTVVQAGTALLMLVTLILGWRALVLSQQQFESSIEPELDVSYQAQFADTNFVTSLTVANTVTNYTFGVPLVNMLTNANIGPTLTKTVFKNIGNVPISNLEIFMWMEVVFDEHLKVKDFIYTRDAKLISNKLAPDQSVTYNFSDELTLQSLLKMSWQERNERALCFIVRFQRTVDMKPKFKLIVFVPRMTIGKQVFAMPVDNNFQYGTFSKNGDIPDDRKMRAEAKNILERLDIPISDY
jgi:hypothetical protein